MPGDVVRRLIAGKDTQRGYCRSVKVRAAVQVIGTKKVIPNISASDLVPVQVYLRRRYSIDIQKENLYIVPRIKSNHV